MTIDERLEKLVERHEALSESVELLTADVRQMVEHTKQQDARYDELRRSITRAILAYMTPEGGMA